MVYLVFWKKTWFLVFFFKNMVFANPDINIQLWIINISSWNIELQKFIFGGTKRSFFSFIFPPHLSPSPGHGAGFSSSSFTFPWAPCRIYSFIFPPHLSPSPGHRAGFIVTYSLVALPYLPVVFKQQMVMAKLQFIRLKLYCTQSLVTSMGTSLASPKRI